MASLYEEKFLPMRMYDHTYDFVLEQLKKEASILDWGCGPGIIAKYIASKRHDIRISGIDNAPNMIERARLNVPHGEFYATDMEHAAFPSNTFDAIFGGFVLPYIAQQELAPIIQKINSIVTSEALLYLSFVEGNPEQSEWKTNTHGDRVYFNYHTREQLQDMLSAMKWNTIQHFDVPYDNSFHTVIISKRNETAEW